MEMFDDEKLGKARRRAHANGFLFVLVVVAVLIIVLVASNPSKQEHLGSENMEHSTMYDVTDVDIFQGSVKIEYPPLEKYSPESKYPAYKTLFQVVSDWSPDVPDPPTIFRETLQHFNYSNLEERKMAQEYRNAEVPFKIYNIPEVDSVSDIWSDEYLGEALKGESCHVEKSKNNHFMYWNMRGGRKQADYEPPTELVSMSFERWLKLAKNADAMKTNNESDHFYFMTGSQAGDHVGRSFISRDLKMFSTRKNNFFITDVRANKGTYFLI